MLILPSKPWFDPLGNFGPFLHWMTQTFVYCKFQKPPFCDALWWIIHCTCVVESAMYIFWVCVVCISALWIRSVNAWLAYSADTPSCPTQILIHTSRLLLHLHMHITTLKILLDALSDPGKFSSAWGNAFACVSPFPCDALARIPPFYLLTSTLNICLSFPFDTWLSSRFGHCLMSTSGHLHYKDWKQVKIKTIFSF